MKAFCTGWGFSLVPSPSSVTIFAPFAAAAGITQERSRRPVHDDGAGPALAETAAEFRAVEPEIVAQHIEQRGIRRDRDPAILAVHVECQLLGHEFSLPELCANALRFI